MSKKTKYELQQELKQLMEETGLKTNVSSINKAQLEEEIKVQKIIILNRAIRTERSKPGRLEPRTIRTIQNEDGIEIPIIPEKSLSKPIEKR
jgi:galactitol-specific phosphotransferase system IIB component